MTVDIIYISEAQQSEADNIFFRVSAYESFKSKLTSNSPVNPLSVRDRLRECKNSEFVWELKRVFVMAVVSRAIRHMRECPLRELLYCLNPEMTARSEYCVLVCVQKAVLNLHLP